MAFEWYWDTTIEGWARHAGSTHPSGTVTWYASDGDPDVGCMRIQQGGAYGPPTPYTDAYVAIVPGGIIGAGGAQVEFRHKRVGVSTTFGIECYVTLRTAGKILLGSVYPTTNVWHTKYVGISSAYAGDIVDELYFRLQPGITTSGDHDLRIDSCTITGVTEESGGGPGVYTPGNTAYGASGGCMDVDAAGGYLYIGALRVLGLPVVIKFSAGVDADGTLVYNPGAGNLAEVACGRQDANTVYANGNFDVPKVLLSIDGGVVWNTIDPAWGGVTTVRPLAIVPTGDGVVVSMTDDQQDAYRSTDWGVIWTALSTALPIVVNAFDLLDINPDESIIGVNAPGAVRVEYSLDAFQHFVDLTVGTPNNGVTRVIVG